MQSLQQITPEFFVNTEQVLGKGQFGVVFKGYMKQQDKLIAVKFMNKKKLNMNPQWKRQVTMMYQISELNHPNIMGFYGHELKQNDGLYLFIQLCKGGTLSSLIKSKMSELKVMSLFEQLIDAMAYINNLKKIHRDLKPDNILLDQNLELKIGDFGVMRNISNSMTKGVCTPLYSAPEVFQMDSYHQKCDVWSAGMILYEMLMGEELFVNVTTKSQLDNQFNKFMIGRRIQFPKQFHISWTLLIERMLVYDKDRRSSFNSILKFFKALKPQMLIDLNNKYDINPQDQENCLNTRSMCQKLSPYIQNHLSDIKQPNQQLSKIVQQKMYEKILKCQKYLTFFRLKNDFIIKIIKLFSSTPLKQIKNVYKYILMFLGASFYISKISEMIINLKRNKIVISQQEVIEVNKLQEKHYQEEWEKIITQFKEKQLNNIEIYRKTLQEQIIVKIINTYMKRQKQAKIIHQIENLQNYLDEASNGVFLKSKLYLELFYKVVNKQQNLLKPKQLMNMNHLDCKAYAFIHLVGKIDKFIPDSMYQNEDFVRVKKQCIQNMEQIQLVNFIGKFDKL